MAPTARGLPSAKVGSWNSGKKARIEAEIQAWAAICNAELQKHVQQVKGQTVLNEFSLAFAHRHSLPLHFEVFRRCAPHMPHEGNIEGWFSTTKGLAQPSSHPDWTSTLARVSINNRVHKPPRQLLWRMHVEQYRSQKAPKEDE